MSIKITRPWGEIQRMPVRVLSAWAKRRWPANTLALSIEDGVTLVIEGPPGEVAVLEGLLDDVARAGYPDAPPDKRPARR